MRARSPRSGLVGAAALALLTGGVPAGRVAAHVEPAGEVCFVAGNTGDVVFINLTPVNATAPGHGQLRSAVVEPHRTASNVNFAPGTVDPNVAIAADVPTSIGRQTGIVCFANSDHADVDLIADPMLALRSGTAEVPAGDARLIDTRITGGPIEPSQRRCFATAAGTAPGAAVFVNLTPVLATAAGSGQLVSSDVVAAPVASNVNFAPGTVDPNLAVARAGSDGRVCFVNSRHARVHLVADQLAALPPGGTWGSLGAAPVRVLDTRAAGGPLQPGERRCFGGVGDPGAMAIVNLTPVGASAAGHGVLVASDTANVPLASNVNFALGTVDPNVAAAQVGPDGTVCFVNSPHAQVDLIVDALMSIGAGVAWPLGSGRFDTRDVTPVGQVCLDGVCIARSEGQLVLLRSDDGGASWSHRTLSRQERPLASVACDQGICRAISEGLYGTPAAGVIGMAQWFSTDSATTWLPAPTTTTAIGCPTDDVCFALGEWRSVYGLSYTPRVSISVDGAGHWTDLDLAGLDPPLYGWSADFTCVEDCETAPLPLFRGVVCPSATRCVASYHDGSELAFTTTDAWASVHIDHTPAGE